jgi:hypothetical protein
VIDREDVTQREAYTTPELTRHGSLDELTQGAGIKEIEKSSLPDLFTF